EGLLEVDGAEALAAHEEGDHPGPTLLHRALGDQAELALEVGQELARRPRVRLAQEVEDPGADPRELVAAAEEEAREEAVEGEAPDPPRGQERLEHPGVGLGREDDRAAAG